MATACWCWAGVILRRDVPSPVCLSSQDPPLSPHLAECPLSLTITPRLLFLTRKSIKKLFILKLLHSLSLLFYSACSTPLCYLPGPCCLSAGEPCYHICRARCKDQLPSCASPPTSMYWHRDARTGTSEGSQRAIKWTYSLPESPDNLRIAQLIQRKSWSFKTALCG